MSVIRNLLDKVGNEKVLAKPSEVRKYMKEGGDKTFGTPQYIVYAHERKDIEKVLETANENRIPVIPASSAVHWYGPHLPHFSGILLDLTRMRGLEGIDKRNRKVRIEPGATWGQVQRSLREHGFMVASPLLPHPDRSVLTDYLERTPPVIPLFEFGEPLLGMEVVWPNGEVFRTGSASAPNFPNTIAEGVNPQGPAALDYWRILQGAQGTMGVVSWANLKTEFIPEQNKTFFVNFSGIQNAVEPLYRIQKRRIGLECLLLNRTNFLKIIAEEFSVDPASFAARLPAWILILVLAGFKRRPMEKIAYEEKELKRISSELCLDITGTIPGGAVVEKAIPPLLRGPWSRRVYWKSSDGFNCRDLFFITTLNRIDKFNELVDRIGLKYDLKSDNVGLYVQPIEHGRSCHFEVNFYYKAKERSEAEMNRIVEELAKECIAGGAFFTRPYGELPKLVYKKTYMYTKVLKQVKQVMDPNNVMCTGALCF